MISAIKIAEWAFCNLLEDEGHLILLLFTIIMFHKRQKKDVFIIMLLYTSLVVNLEVCFKLEMGNIQSHKKDFTYF